MWEIIEESFIDSIKMLPFLIGAYVLIEYLDRGAGKKMRGLLGNFKTLGPVGGALLGIIPQCGFSVAAANLFGKRLITAGTLIAVFLATSDEAIPVFLANPGNGGLIIRLLVIKLILAICAGIFIDATARYVKLDSQSRTLSVDEVETNSNECDCNCKHGQSLIRAVLGHSMKIFALVLAVSFIMNCGLHFLGEENLSKVLMENSIFQPFLAGLFGLIPSCASSVILAELYVKGSLSFGSVLAGLSTGAGMGIIVLFKENRSKRENILIIGALYGIGVLSGLVATQIF